VEYPGILDSLAEASVTLAGFAAVFRAFGGDTDPDGYSRVRLNAVIEGGLVLAFVSYLPVAVENSVVPDGVGLRASSAILALFVVLRSILPGIRIFQGGWPLPALFPLAWGLSVVGILFLAASIFGVSVISTLAAHQAGVVSIFGGLATTFVAQFRVERSG
jgi:hypothetical protein